MHSEYPDVSFSWNIREFENKNVPMQELFLDWDLKLLEGKIEGGERVQADLRDIIHKQEKRLTKHTKSNRSDKTMLDRHHLTTRFKNWNVFYVDHPATEVLWSFIKEARDKYLNLHNLAEPAHSSIHSWANVLRKGDEISKHAHVPSADTSACYISTNYCVTADESTATVYDLPGFSNREISFTNRPGQLLVFPPWIPHYTTPFEKEDSTRITIASDIIMSHWYPGSFHEGERYRHFLPLDLPPAVKRRRKSGTEGWEDIPSVDPTIAELVNYDGELTEEVVVEMKENGTDFAERALVPDAVADNQSRNE